MICRYKIKFISDIEQKIRKLLVNIAVAPFVGVWIEISKDKSNCMISVVAPFVGVWIEITYKHIKRWFYPSLPLWECGLKCKKASNLFVRQTSLPLWECGLKCNKNGSKARYGGVAPFVGVWIEIYEKT